MSSLRLWIRRVGIPGRKIAFLAISLSGTLIAKAQSPTHWELNTFASGGFVPAYQIHSPYLRFGETLEFYSAGAVGGRMLTEPLGRGLLRGRGEALVEVTPYWLAYYPKQVNLTYFNNSPYPPLRIDLGGPYSIHGASITPLLLRWDFTRHDASRIMPWVQIGGGLLWTNHKFPLLGGSTSVINFTPQAGIGVHVFTRERQSVNVGLKAVHISSAGLGDNNPGLNVTLQFTAGYSWWW